MNIQKYSSLRINHEKNNSLFNNENNSQHQKIKPVQNKNDLLNSIYKVNLNKIHFSIYDFNKDMVIELNIEKTSKVESIIKNPKSRFSIEINNINEYTNNLLNSIMDNKKKDNSLKNKKNNMKNEELNEDKIIENKIMEAINKEYDEENSINIHKYSLLCMLLLILGSIIYLYFEINLYSDSITILNIIKNIISINYSNKFGLYFIRELTLLNIPNTGIKGGQYVKIPASNRIEYISFVKKNILELFVESQVAMSEFIGTSFSISESSNALLTQTKLINKLSNYESKSTIIKNNIIINLVQLNSAFYNLASSTSPVEQNHADLYNFVYNSLNNYGIAINILINTYIKELNIKVKSYILKFQIQLYIYLFIYILVYIIALIMYSKKIQTKKSYIKVFLNINLDFIIYSINKCEEFMNKYKLLEEKKIQEEEIEYSYDEKDSLIQPEKHFKDSNSNLKENSFNINNNNTIKKKFNFSKNLLFKIFFGIFMLIIYLYYYIYGYFYSLLVIEKTIRITTLYYHLQKYHLNIIEYFNIYREYLFDNDSLILNKTPFENLQRKENEIYGNWTDDIKNITYLSNLLITDKDIKKELNKSLCSYIMTDYYKSEEDCIKSVGNIYTQDTNTFCYGFIDEIRIKKNIIRILFKSGIILGNLAEYNTESWYDDYFILLENEKNEDITTKIRFRLELFNEGYFHFISNIYFLNIILPSINQNRKIIFEYLTIVGKHYAYFIIFIIYILINVLVYVLYYIPMIKNLNKSINEIKSMLKIIPIQILMADNNINNLLQINIKK